MGKGYELLAPAGSFDSLIAAVQNGADAVYLAGKSFGARKYANNFSMEELKKALEYAHIRGVSVFVTVNTLVADEEFDHLKEVIDDLYIMGVDALIVQDMGVLQFLRNHYPDLEIHCSTQMSVQRVEDVRFLESLGVKRVVLGREMTLEEIRRVKNETSLELEVFVHGALCISVSGQCLMSSMAGGRSGNRGQCAQPCRQRYNLQGNDQGKSVGREPGRYLLSPRDLNTIERVYEILEAGAYSLKIEGRMKNPEYVASVVGSYKQALKGKAVSGGSFNKQLSIFNRGFTQGHLFGANAKQFMSVEHPGNHGTYLGKVTGYDSRGKRVHIALEDHLYQNDEIQIRKKGNSVGGRVEVLQENNRVVREVQKGKNAWVNFKHHCSPGDAVYKTYDVEVMKKARATFHKETLEIPLESEVWISEGRGIHGQISDGIHTVEFTGDSVVEKAVNRPVTKDDVIRQMKKLGNTPYSMQRVDVHIEGSLSFPMKEMNHVRRQLVSQLNEKRSTPYSRRTRRWSKESYDESKGLKGSIPMTFTYSVETLEQMEVLMDLGVEEICFQNVTVESLKDAVEMGRVKKYSGTIIPVIDRLITGGEMKKVRREMVNLELGTVLQQSFGGIKEFQGFQQNGDFTLNIFNRESLKAFRSQGLKRIALSPELTLEQAGKIAARHPDTEIIGYGHLPVMLMKHCVVSHQSGYRKNCRECSRKVFTLVDRKGEQFGIQKKRGCFTELLNGKRHFLLEETDCLQKAGVSHYRLMFTVEGPEEVKNLTLLHRHYLSRTMEECDRVYMKAVKESGITKGHNYRGVL